MIWMGWQKKMLWFTLTTVLSILDDWVYFVTHGYPIVYVGWSGLIMVAILVVPLFYLKDDKVKK